MSWLGRSIIAVVVAGLALSASSCAGVTDAADSPSPQPSPSDRGQQAPSPGSDGYIRYSYDPADIPDGVVSDIAGTKLPNGSCRQAGELRLSVGQTVVARRAVAVNPETCQFKVITGTPTESHLRQLQSVGEGMAARSDSSKPKSLGRATGKGVKGNPDVSAGYLETFFHDPPNITVNSVKNSTKWRWGAPSGVQGLLGGYEYNWLAGTGWFMQGANWQNVYDSYQTTSSSYALFENDKFCAFQSVFSDYNRNTVNGRNNGDLVGSWADVSYGAICYKMLSLEYVLQRTQN